MAPSVKTAFSAGEDIIHDADTLSKELGVSRSALIVMALKAFIKKYKREKMKDRINEAFSDYPVNEDVDIDRLSVQSARELFKDDRW